MGVEGVEESSDPHRPVVHRSADATTRVVVVGEPSDPGAHVPGQRILTVNIMRPSNQHIPTYPGVLWNPFKMGESGRDEKHRDAAVGAHRAWMRARNVPARCFMMERGGLAAAVPAIAPSGANGGKVGSSAWQAAHAVAVAGRRMDVIRLECTSACARCARGGGGCHGFALAEAVRSRL